MKRILICGTSGSGKSTLARKLAAWEGLPYIEVDSHFHLPGWKQRSREELRERLIPILNQESWVLDANYSAVRDITYATADTIIWLDYPFMVTFGRMVRRTVRRVITGEPVCNGNRETFRKSFLSRDSIILWMVTTHGRRRQECDALFATPTPPHQTRLRFRTPWQLAGWLAWITR